MTDQKAIDSQSKVRELRDAQGQHGNWNCNPYMLGLHNGLELALSVAEGRDPEFKSAPAQWLDSLAPPTNDDSASGSPGSESPAAR